MSYVGDIRLEDTIDVKFTTRKFSTGAPFALASGVISAYVGNSTTQITAGITLSADFDGVTGLNNVRVVATAANGYTAATNVQLVITTGTVDSVSVVGEVIGQFSIEARSALMPTTVARKLDVSAGGEAGLDWANIGSPTTAQNLSGTNIDTDQVVASVAGAVGSVTGITASDVGAIKTKTDFLPSATAGAAGGVFIAGTNAATTITTALTTTFTGNLTGSVASVTGAVGSVTGNVGGNVVGSVGSVAGAVGSVTGAVGSVTGNVGGNVVGTVASVVGAVGSVTGLTASDVGAIKTKTDSLTFTTAGQVDANIQSVNDVAIQGTGAVGSDEWRAV
jgi:hypothetical protein